MAEPVPVEALLALHGKGQAAVGRDRIAMLEAVAAHGSITQAARALGLSYKTVWDGINAINNLLPRPALLASPGGKGGGHAELTEEGRRLVAAFRRLEEKLAAISRIIAEDGLPPTASPDLLFWSVAMKTSARNAFRCEVAAIRRAPVNVEVTLRLSDHHDIAAVITNEAADELGLAEGRAVMALVKASFVMLAPAAPGLRLSTPNRIEGTVLHRVDGGINSEVVLDIGAGKTLTAVVTRDSADALPCRDGDRLCAFFSPAHVILAVD